MRVCLIILLLLTGINLQSQDTDQQLEAVFEDFELMGMSVWTYCHGNENQYHFGLRDYTRSLPVNQQTMYRIASISKTFTALGLLKLHQQGAFELEDNISDYMGYTIENPQFPGTPITFTMLLSHTSSLQDGSGYSNFLSGTLNNIPVPSIAEVLLPGGQFYTSNMWRLEAPGTHFAYSNINYGLIGTLIEKISGQRFDLFMQSEILEPLGVSGSYNVTLLEDIDDVAVLYRNQGGWTPQIDNYQGEMPPPPMLDGSAADLVSDSDCFIAGSSPGCDNPGCESVVCAEDSWCCNNEWDNLCVALALEICEGSPSNCLSANGNAGCDNAECQTLVCDLNPDCCELEWDSDCAGLAWENCGPGPYVPGTNGAYFGPQGSLRASAEDVGKMIRFIQTSGASAPGIIDAGILAEMTGVAWNFNGSNGDNYFGLFNRWGLGVHHANTTSGDQLCADQGWGSFIGHPGEAYGLVSDAYYAENEDVAFVFMHNGIWPGYDPGAQSTWYLLEESIFEVLCNYFSTCTMATDIIENGPVFNVFPNPASDVFTVEVPSAHSSHIYELQLFNNSGNSVHHSTFTGERHQINVNHLAAGIYYFRLNTDRKIWSTGKIVID